MREREGKEGMRTNRHGIPIQRSNNGESDLLSSFPFGRWCSDHPFCHRQPRRYPARLSDEISAGRIYADVYVRTYG